MEAKAHHVLSVQCCGENSFTWGDNPKTLRFTRALLVPQQLPVENFEHGRSPIFVSSHLGTTVSSAREMLHSLLRVQNKELVHEGRCLI